MGDELNAVTPPAASPETGAPNPASMATDRGGSEATPATTGGSAPTPEIANLVSGGAQSVPGQSAGSDAAATPFLTDEEIQTAPRQWRDRFGQIKQGYDRLESDHKGLREQWQPWNEVKDQYGDPAAVLQDLQILNGFRGYKTNEHGQVQYDETTGLPQYDVRPGLEMLSKQSPAMPGRLFEELMYFNGPSGQSFAREFFTALGLDPDRLDDYRNFTSGQYVANTTGVSSDKLASIAEDRRDAFKSLSPATQEDFFNMPDSVQQDILNQAQERLDDRKWKDEIKQEREQAKQREMTQFKMDVETAQNNYIAELRSQSLDSIVSNLANQVTFSADPTINMVQQGVVKATLATMLDPDLRFAVAPMLQGLGIPMDGSLDQALSQVVQHASVYKRYEAYGKHPSFAEHRDDYAMNTAKANADASLLRAKALLNNVALKVAQALGGQVQQTAAVIDQKLAAASSRPTVNGTSNSETAVVGGAKRGAPFSKERWDSYGS